jgi:hypothetical protein
MIDACARAVRPHPDQATSNPGCWAIQLRVSHAGRSRTFWRWCTFSSDEKLSHAAILARFWDDTFSELHGLEPSE